MAAALNFQYSASRWQNWTKLKVNFTFSLINTHTHTHTESPLKDRTFSDTMYTQDTYPKPNLNLKPKS